MDLLFGKKPQEDPNAAEARRRADERAQNDRVNALQGELSLDTNIRNQKGLTSLLGPLGSGKRTYLGSG